MTEPERLLWSRLRDDQLSVTFRRQHPIGPHIVDFYCRAAGLVVEVDGDSHFTEEGKASDAERTAYLEALGLTVLRFTNAEVTRNLESTLLAIDTAAQATRPLDDRGREWRRVSTLRLGDALFCGPELRRAAVTSLKEEESREEVCRLEVEVSHSFVTEVCVMSDSRGAPFA